MNEEILSAMKHANGSRRQRTLSANDAAKFEALVDENKDNQAVTSIRVYSSEGSVPNAYKYRAEISVLQAARSLETGLLMISGFTVD